MILPPELLTPYYFDLTYFDLTEEDGVSIWAVMLTRIFSSPSPVHSTAKLKPGIQ
jgi:hypothetical protein